MVIGSAILFVQLFEGVHSWFNLFIKLMVLIFLLLISFSIEYSIAHKVVRHYEKISVFLSDVSNYLSKNLPLKEGDVIHCFFLYSYREFESREKLVAVVNSLKRPFWVNRVLEYCFICFTLLAFLIGFSVDCFYGETALVKSLFINEAYFIFGRFFQILFHLLAIVSWLWFTANDGKVDEIIIGSRHHWLWFC